MILVLGIFGKASTLLIVFGFLLFAIVVLTHQKNIVRLLNGNESRVYLRRRRNK
jgi:glycerol-3-phosphate acyltransferase PlsY